MRNKRDTEEKGAGEGEDTKEKKDLKDVERIRRMIGTLISPMGSPNSHPFCPDYTYCYFVIINNSTSTSPQSYTSELHILYSLHKNYFKYTSILHCAKVPLECSYV